MEITAVVLGAYSQLGVIEDDLREGRVVAALNKSERLVAMLADQEEDIKRNPNYLLLKRDIRSLAEEAEAMHSMAYGSELIGSSPFGAVIHLGNHFMTKNWPELEPLRQELHQRAYDAWTGSEWINDRGDKKEVDDQTPLEYIGFAC